MTKNERSISKFDLSPITSKWHGNFTIVYNFYLAIELLDATDGQGKSE